MCKNTKIFVQNHQNLLDLTPLFVMAAIVESSQAIADQKKAAANELFTAGKFEEAEALYTEALELAEAAFRVVLLTNRSAARIGSKKYELALEDAEAALALDPSWLKAYYRKATAFEGLQRPDEVFYTWAAAIKACEQNPLFTKHYYQAEKKWRTLFRSEQVPVRGVEDLLSRFKLLTDKRERLSSLAHFWNESSGEERFSFFKLLLSLIGGATASVLDNDAINPQTMVAMPLDNYPDFPRKRLAGWFDFFAALSSESKAAAFKLLWFALTSAEQHEVIVDMRLFVAKASGKEEEFAALMAARRQEEEGAGAEGIDFSYRQHFGSSSNKP